MKFSAVLLVKIKCSILLRNSAVPCWIFDIRLLIYLFLGLITIVFRQGIRSNAGYFFVDLVDEEKLDVTSWVA
jgi:hypothetical protein